MSTEPPGRRSVLITGAGGGLGGSTASMFAARGWTVFGADLVPPPASADLVPIAMDVTDLDSIDQAVHLIEKHCPDGLDAVVNFAGVLDIAPLVEIPDERMCRILDINVLGTYRVNKAAFPLVQRRRGRIINISSETGWQRGVPLGGPYAMTKHAIEAYSDALRRELMFVGVRVVVIQPGPFQTTLTQGITDAFARAVIPGSPFAPLVRKAAAVGAQAHRRAHDPELLARVVWKAATSKHPDIRYSVRPDLQRSLLHLLPTALADQLIYLAMR
ncbi:SDR family NAD(P)-dependent oxidoreductase [Mycobacterium sp. PDNC021]|uniref:SDR family NAD(P)-dependent oxidoreductase n=1 Tax=Mycobacterium sp. PDNC021 TaxID=3391399 RepID=UPI003AAD9F7D